MRSSLTALRFVGGTGHGWDQYSHSPSRAELRQSRPVMLRDETVTARRRQSRAGIRRESENSQKKVREYSRSVQEIQISVTLLGPNTKTVCSGLRESLIFGSLGDF